MTRSTQADLLNSALAFGIVRLIVMVDLSTSLSEDLTCQYSTSLC